MILCYWIYKQTNDEHRDKSLIPEDKSNPKPQPYIQTASINFPMSSPVSSTYEDAYTQLIAALHPSPAVVLEIEILPSSFAPQILHESSALGVPKSLLVSLYLKARETFFDHVSSGESGSYRAALQSTAIILLFDPNHLTAANFRKRHLQRFSSARPNDNDDNDQGGGQLAEAVQSELRFLESLVTSPLSKHAKSSTLWAQRLWIVRDFFAPTMQEYATDEAIQMRDMKYAVRGFWDEELVIVKKAGERHPRNYYAWHYARQLFSSVCSECRELVERRNWNKILLCDSIGLVYEWCLMHPRDISGWAFLVFLLEQRRIEGCDEGDGKKVLEDERGISASETKEFVKKYEWKGEGIKWFLNAMKMLEFDE